MRCAGLGTVPAGCMVSCTATASPLASVPLKTLRPTELLGAVFAVISSTEKTRAVASGLEPVNSAAGLAAANMRNHAGQNESLHRDLSLTTQSMAGIRLDQDLGSRPLRPHCRELQQ